MTVLCGACRRHWWYPSLGASHSHPPLAVPRDLRVSILPRYPLVLPTLKASGGATGDGDIAPSIRGAGICTATCFHELERTSVDGGHAGIAGRRKAPVRRYRISSGNNWLLVKPGTVFSNHAAERRCRSALLTVRGFGIVRRTDGAAAGERVHHAIGAGGQTVTASTSRLIPPALRSIGGLFDRSASRLAHQ